MIDVPELRKNLVINPKVAFIWTDEKMLEGIPLSFIQKDEKEYGILTNNSLSSPVKNTMWKYLFFTDSSVFSPAANAFKKSEIEVKGTPIKPSYCPHLKGTTPYKKYWREQIRRCREGYEPEVDGKPCGVRITGEHYFYLNFSRITLLERDAKTGKDISIDQFPRFLAMDYYWFKELEARENPDLYNLSLSYKKSMIAAKARRKGFSYKASAGAVWTAVFNKNAKVAIASETGGDATLCFEKCLTIIDFLSEYTEMGMPVLDPATNGGWATPIARTHTKDRGHVIIGRKNTRTGALGGRKSEIYTITLHNQPDKAAGAGVDRLIFEEAGKISDLKKAWTFAEPTLRSGEIYRGIGIIFGTGGDMGGGTKKGSSRDFSELFYNPETAGLAGFENIYEKTDKKDAKCGWFIDDMWFRESRIPLVIDGKEYFPIDSNGNSNRWVAEIKLNQERQNKSKGKRDEYNTFLTQYCKTPSEAFLVLHGSIFPTADLFARYSSIKSSRLSFNAFRMAGELVEEGPQVYFKPDHDGKLKPIDTLGSGDIGDREGCVLQYEKPLKVNGKIPQDAYIIAVDPIGQNTDSGKSLCSIVVMKTPKYETILGPEKIVMTYRGRSAENPMGFVHELLMKMSKYYNAQITFENDRDGGILQYFLRKNQLQRLMSKPFRTMSKHLTSGSKTLLREYGHSMATQRHKRIGEDLLLEWLLTRQASKTVVDDSGEVQKIEGLRNLDVLEDKAVLEELIAYTRDGNFDMVMALMGAVIQLNERFSDDVAIQESIEDVSSFWGDVFTDLYGSSSDKYEMHKRKLEMKKSQNKKDVHKLY